MTETCLAGGTRFRCRVGVGLRCRVWCWSRARNGRIDCRAISPCITIWPIPAYRSLERELLRGAHRTADGRREDLRGRNGGARRWTATERSGSRSSAAQANLAFNSPRRAHAQRRHLLPATRHGRLHGAALRGIRAPLLPSRTRTSRFLARSECRCPRDPHAITSKAPCGDIVDALYLADTEQTAWAPGPGSTQIHRRNILPDWIEKYASR